MSGHDPCCPIYDLPVADCVVCTAIGEARSEEKNTATAIWKANLRLIERRNYDQGFRDGVEHARLRDAPHVDPCDCDDCRGRV